MMARKKRSYRANAPIWVPNSAYNPGLPGVASTNFKWTGTIILALLIGVPIFVFGIGTVIKFFTSPIVNGKISVWWIMLGVFVFAMMQRNKKYR